MIRLIDKTTLHVIIYGIIAAIGDGVACAAISLKSFLVIPIWLTFVPAALAWMAAGMQGIKPEGLIGVGTISLVGGPTIAIMMVVLPMAIEDRMAIGFSTIRQTLAVSLAIMLPLSIMCMLAGAIVKGAIVTYFNGRQNGISNKS